jgi:hypothetical protein
MIFFRLQTITMGLSLFIGTGPFLHEFQYEGEHEGHGQIHHSQSDVGGLVLEGIPGIKVGDLGNIAYSQDRDQRAIFEHGNEIIAKSREDVLMAWGRIM